jgi:hypothetical protein
MGWRHRRVIVPVRPRNDSGKSLPERQLARIELLSYRYWFASLTSRQNADVKIPSIGRRPMKDAVKNSYGQKRNCE